MTEESWAPTVGVEGDYEEILAWMEAHPVAKVGYIAGRGVSEPVEGGGATPLNFGLFSICADAKKGSWEYNQDKKRVLFHILGSEAQYWDLTAEEQRTGHLIPPEGGWSRPGLDAAAHCPLESAPTATKERLER